MRVSHENRLALTHPRLAGLGNQALQMLKHDELKGAGVLRVG